tara:strand:+ start:192 stop:371 length:180 start_codon:yes stop_codon:yes gene_type:complete
MDKELKTIMLGDFHKPDTYYLSELVATELEEMGIRAESFAFHIEVEYMEAEETDDGQSI